MQAGVRSTEAKSVTLPTPAQIAALRPTAVRGVIEQEIDNDLLLYNPRTDSVHVLNETAAAVWWLCDGRRSGLQISQEVAQLYAQQVPDIDSEALEALAKLLAAGAVTLA